MKKRKILAMLMVAALSAGMLAGCGSDDTKEESKSTEAADTKENTEENKDTEETKEELNTTVLNGRWFSSIIDNKYAVKE